MKMYHVTWEINLDANSAQEAAELALQIQRDPLSIATQFTVCEDDVLGEPELVDLPFVYISTADVVTSPEREDH